MRRRYLFMKRFAAALAFAALSCSAVAEWVVVNDNDEYIAYADPDTIFREGDRVQMSDLIDLKFPRPSPYGNQHASSTANSEFDCRNSRFRRIALSLHSGRMGNGELVEAVGESNGWLFVAPGTLLSVLRQFACN